ncbi:MAG: OmpH family outer membrane protein [Bacteroidia bacterium]|jgi:outer membrane protein|nr:OmpH family outer membrane protein [Bacteroidia bacterium]
MMKWSLWQAGILVLSIIAISMSFYSVINTPKLGYVIINEAFDAFDYKKEMEKEYLNIRNTRKRLLDSLQVDISVLSSRIRQGENQKEIVDLLNRKRIELNSKMEQFDEANELLAKDSDKKIIKQLNQYVEEYGKRNGYSILFGNTNGGTIMFGKEAYDCTKEVIQFINLRYAGTK